MKHVKIYINPMLMIHIYNTLKWAVDECIFDISPGGLKVKAVDPANVCMVELNVPASDFNIFDVDEYCKIGVNLDHFEIVGINKNEDVVGIEFKQKPEGSIIIVFDMEGWKYEFPCPVLNSVRKEPKIPKLDLSAKIHIDTSKLKDAVGKIEKITDHILIRTNEKHVEFLGLDPITDKKCCGSYEIIPNTEKCIAKYSLDYLSDLIKGVASEQVDIMFDTDYPMIMEFKIGDSGIGRYFLAPRIRWMR